jgi:hypothetical protein
VPESVERSDKAAVSTNDLVTSRADDLVPDVLASTTEFITAQVR